MWKTAVGLYLLVICTKLEWTASHLAPVEEGPDTAAPVSAAAVPADFLKGSQPIKEVLNGL